MNRVKHWEIADKGRRMKEQRSKNLGKGIKIIKWSTGSGTGITSCINRDKNEVTVCKGYSKLSLQLP